MIFSIEGNIGAGKTTLLQHFEDNKNDMFSRPHIIVYEPVDDWLNFKLEDSDESLFEMFYKDKPKYAFVFQMMALQSRLQHLTKFMKQHQDEIIFCERSILTDCEIFAKLQHQQGNISDIEFHVYKNWHTYFVNELQPNIKGMIYLRTDPEICKQRIQKRNRIGEHDIEDDYLNHLHQCHETWINSNSVNDKYKCLILDNNNNGNSFEINIDKIKTFVNDLIVV